MIITRVVKGISAHNVGRVRYEIKTANRRGRKRGVDGDLVTVKMNREGETFTATVCFDTKNLTLYGGGVLSQVWGLKNELPVVMPLVNDDHPASTHCEVCADRGTSLKSYVVIKDGKSIMISGHCLNVSRESAIGRRAGLVARLLWELGRLTRYGKLNPAAPHREFFVRDWPA